MKPILTTIIAIAFTALSSNASAQNEINDQNTPLHLIQPQYDTPYGIPAEAEVKATIDRVLAYLEQAMPATAEGNKLAKGSFRLTSYEAGVLYAAMLNAGKQTGDERFTRFAADRLGLIARQAPKEAKALEKDKEYDPQMRMVLFPGALDDCGAMASAYCRLNMAQADKAYGAVIDRYVDFVRNKQYRLPDGIFARHRPHHNTVWLDDMYMGVPCMAWYGIMNNDITAIHDAVKQIKLFKERMWVPEKKLFRHGWVESMTPHPAYHWGRANGWAILTQCEVLDALTIKGKSEETAADRAFVLDLLRQHIEGLSALQDKTGFWHQLLDRPDTYNETSCTAIYTYCMAHAINEGWIDAQTYGAQVLLAWQACQTKVNAKGQVEGTCVGTGMGFEPAFYAYRPVHAMAAHGYGPMIWAGAEVIRMLRTTHPKMNDSAIQFYKTEQKTDKPIFIEGNTDAEILW
ncbi:MAG: glycoside hydrolase family 88 protein [Prevotellaceae bacterium]|nr:glycoside hydrolase family 88 protein [Prevotellaceae bacterium]MDY2750629.1 glycoside hydrolase family 88 protein [Prevotella sp.]